MALDPNDINVDVEHAAAPLLEIDNNSAIIKDVLVSGLNSNAVTIQGQPVSTTPPTEGQVLMFLSGVWTPSTLV